MRPTMGKYSEISRPFQKLYIDFLGPYPRSKSGNSMIVIVVDQFSKFVFLKAIRKASANAVVEFLKHEIFHLFGIPEILFSDNGKQFT